MGKVTWIAYSKRLNSGKLDRLSELATRLGKLRAEVWRRYGSVQGVGLTDRQIRDQWLAEGRIFDVPAKLWRETLRDTFADITAYRAAAKAEVRKHIRRRSSGKDDKAQEHERIRLHTLLRHDAWLQDKYLRRLMRRFFRHGRTRVKNQIVLDPQCYTVFEHNGQAWIKIMSLTRGKRIAIPLNTSFLPSRTLRLIIRDERVEVHYAIEETECSTRPCGEATLGIDKGYTEIFVDSDGEKHGAGLGELLGRESDYLKVKYQRRNKLKALADAKPHKRQNIIKNNLSRKKLDKRKKQHRQRVRDKVFKATHSVVDKAAVIVAEDLTRPIKKSKAYGRNQDRRLSGWVKGVMADALLSVSRRRGSSLVLVNCAYTSQMDSRYGILLGERKGDLFYCFDGDVLQADHNAARNIQARTHDPEIHRYMPYRKVRTILLERTEIFKNGGDCSTQTRVTSREIGLLTVCELPNST